MSENGPENFTSEYSPSERMEEQSIDNNLTPAPEASAAPVENVAFDNGFHPENIPAIKELDGKIEAIKTEIQQNTMPVSSVNPEMQQNIALMPAVNQETTNQLLDEVDPEAGLNMTIRGENDWQNRLNPDRMAAETKVVDSLNGFDGQTTAQQQTEEGKVLAETPTPSEESAEPKMSEVANVEASEAAVTKVEDSDQEPIGLTKEQLEYAEALDAEIRERQLNPVEEENLKVAMALTEKYPNGLSKSVDKNGNHFIIIRDSSGKPDDNLKIFCKRGVIVLKNDNVKEGQYANYVGKVSDFEKKNLVDFSRLIDQTIDRRMSSLADLSFFNENGQQIDTRNRYVEFTQRNFADLSDAEKKQLREQMKKAEKYQKSKRVDSLVAEL